MEEYTTAENAFQGGINLKRLAIICIVVIIIVAVCGCADVSMFEKIPPSDEAIADAQMEAILNALESCDSGQLVSLFAANTQSETRDMQESFNMLSSYYQGNYISYNNWSATGTSTTRDGSHIVKEIYGTYDVTTNVGIYRFAFLYVSTDSVDPNNVGLKSTYVIKMDDDTDPQYAYRGDGLYTPGIHIGITNDLPDEE